MEYAQELIDELEQIKAILSARGVTRLDRIAVLEKYLDIRLKRLATQNNKDN